MRHGTFDNGGIKVINDRIFICGLTIPLSTVKIRHLSPLVKLFWNW